VVIFSKTYCGYSRRAKSIFDRLGQKYHTIELDVDPNGPALQKGLEEMTGRSTVPNVFIAGKSVGGSDEVASLQSSGSLEQMLAAVSQPAA